MTKVPTAWPMLRPKSEDFKSLSDFYYEWADRVALLIIVGLMFDIAAAFILGKALPEIALTVVANSLIVGGVWENYGS